MSRPIDLAALLAGCADDSFDDGIRIDSRLEPLSGPGGMVKPAVYEGGTYQRDRRWASPADSEPTPVIVIDNVPSQANRLEEALRSHRDSTSIPVFSVTLDGAVCDVEQRPAMAGARRPRYHRAVSVPPCPAPPAPEGQPMSPAAVALPVVEYPSSDGQPMAETPVHRDVMIDAIQILKKRYANRSDVYVSGDMLMYYEEGNPRKSVAPDVFVVLGASRDEDRDTYLLWREPKAPDFVLEVTSKSTRRNDLVTKRALYESLGVAEYFMFDPRAEYLNPPLQGFGLHRGHYAALPVAALPNGAPALYSEALGLFLHVREQALRLHDPAVGEDLLTALEEASARRAVEAENARLRARIHELENSAHTPEPPQP